jgi:CubicO group peptidase (beta-lactamase class C family)
LNAKRLAGWIAALGILGLFTGWIPVVPAHAAPEGLSRDVIDRIDSTIRKQMAQAKIPGLSIAVVTDLQLRWTAKSLLPD